MFKNVIFSLLIIMCYPILSCKKSVGKLTTYTVTEYKSNNPIPGASVSFYTIGSFDLNCGCWTDQLQATKLTDQNGQCTLGDEEFTLSTTSISVDKDHYYSSGSSSTPLETNYVLEPVGRIELHLARVNSYSGQIYMDMSINGERARIGTRLTEFPAPADSLIFVDGFGGETNNISYKIYDSTTSTVIFNSAQIPLAVSKSGSTLLGINY